MSRAAWRQDGRAHPTPPYAIIEQRELIRLRELMAAAVNAWKAPNDRPPSQGNVLVALVTLRVRKNIGTGDTRDGLKSLGLYGGLSVSSMRRSLKWLVEQKIVVETRLADPVKGGGRGVAWAWPRIVLPFEAWGRGEEALTLNASSVETQIARLRAGRPTYQELRQRKAAVGRL